MTHQEISILRLQSQHLLAGKIQTAAELVYHFGAVQGQEYEQTKWGLGIRLPHLNNTDIENEIESGTIRRTHLLRPTWHFVHVDDLFWIQALTSERVQAINKFMYKQLELTDKILDRTATIIARTLENGEALTRPEISAILARHRINLEGFRMGYILMNAELKGIISNGRRKGKQQTYTLLNPGIRKKGNLASMHDAGSMRSNKTDRDEGLQKLSARYFKSRGPATVKDFSTWSGLKIADCQLAITLNGQSLNKFKFEEDNYFYLSAQTSGLTKVSEPPGILVPGNKTESHRKSSGSNELFLLPVYDELIMGYRDRKSIMQNFQQGQRYKYDCMILYNGQVIGTYKRVIKPATAIFEFDYFKPPNKKQKALVNKALTRFEDFADCKVIVAPN